MYSQGLSYPEPRSTKKKLYKLTCNNAYNVEKRANSNKGYANAVDQTTMTTKTTKVSSDGAKKIENQNSPSTTSSQEKTSMDSSTPSATEVKEIKVIERIIESNDWHID